MSNAFKKSVELQSFTEEVHLTRDRNDVLTGGKTVIRIAHDGREIARFGYDASGQETFRQVCSYNDAIEREVVVHTFFPNGSLMQKAVSRFNREGDLIEETIMEPDGAVTDRQIYTYTSEVVHYAHFGKNDTLIETWTKRIQ